MSEKPGPALIGARDAPRLARIAELLRARPMPLRDFFARCERVALNARRCQRAVSRDGAMIGTSLRTGLTWIAFPEAWETALGRHWREKLRGF